MVNYVGKDKHDQLIEPIYARRAIAKPFPSRKFPREGMSADVALQLCNDELQLDGSPELNLASFVTTWMEPQARTLISDHLNKNLVDRDEYPHAAKIEQRCVHMLADLFHAPSSEDQKATGTATVGSSEAVMLAGLALKWRWRQKRQHSSAKPVVAATPNIVMGSNVQVVWEKFARYFDVTPRYIDITAEQTTITPEQVVEAVDDNTIAVVAILGTTFTGEFEPITAIAKALDAYQKHHGVDIPLHIDAASGGFIAPFTQPKLKWDFRLKRVASINVSGHKYGLVYPGVGWVIWRDEEALPKELIFDVNYLGGHMPTFNLNFSRPSAFVIAQYYNFLRLGFRGYGDIMQMLLTLSERLAAGLAKMNVFHFLSQANSLPVVAVSLHADCGFDVYQLSERLRLKKWIVPAYSLPKPADQTSILRFVIRESMSAGLIDQLLIDTKEAIADLKEGEGGKLRRHSDSQPDPGHHPC